MEKKYPTLNIGYLYYQKYPKSFIRHLYQLYKTSKTFNVIYIGNELAKSSMLNLAAQKEFKNKSHDDFKKIFSDIEIIDLLNNENFLNMNYEIDFVPILPSFLMEFKRKPQNIKTFNKQIAATIASNFRPDILFSHSNIISSERETNKFLHKKIQIFEGSSQYKIVIHLNLFIDSYSQYNEWFEYFSKDISRLCAFILFSNTHIIN